MTNAVSPTVCTAGKTPARVSQFRVAVPAPGKETSGRPSEIAYIVRKSERARRVRLRVHADGVVEVVVPKRARVTGWDDFVRENADWVFRQKARFAKLHAQKERSGYLLSGSVTYQGQSVPLTFEPSSNGRLSVRFDGEGFRVGAPVGTKPEDVQNLLEAWFRRAARVHIEERVRALNARTGYTWTGLRIGEQKTRWGSCSRRGTLSFNWRLLMAPPEVLDYVVIHELAHLKEMNHSPRFWALVADACPDFKRHVAWLKDHGPLLVF